MSDKITSFSLAGSIDKRVNDTQFVGMRCKTKVIRQWAHESFLTVINTSGRKMSIVVYQNI